MLNIRGLTAGYGHCQALFGVDLEVREGQVLGLIGRNGMGRSTVIKCLFGLLPIQDGSIHYRDQALRGMAPYRIGRLGLSLVPEGRQIFPTLTVEENLLATAVARGGARAWTLERVYALFPRLRERRANLGSQLSGGEQQMLALGRALMTNPSLLVLDEATEGLAPVVRAEIWRVLAQLKADGLSMIVVDKNTTALLRLSDRNVILDKGVSVWDGSSAELAARPDLVATYVGV
ncbi:MULTISPECIES: ABC transporter ATP-binding protein [Bordetella]|uniref:ABC transporter ATP-binding protein n=1 Tax=Bordetella genomosp. 2 TaxID=1983456 RepID=A0A261VL09_9BORD|nr:MULTISPECIES: ABC transporter ATP-binding protein [Bordetella]OZI73863.1 ABC transporter ATP-binding protein [Bordetella genomosp. 2]